MKKELIRWLRQRIRLLACRRSIWFYRQSNLFGKTYEYKFDFKTIRGKIEELAKSQNYSFKYQTTPIGL